MRITFTDADGQQVTIEGEITPADLQRADPTHPILLDGRVCQYVQLGGKHCLAYCDEGVRTYPEPPESGSITIKMPRATNDLLDVLNGVVHAPPPSSARWEGPPPRRARR